MAARSIPAVTLPLPGRRAGRAPARPSRGADDDARCDEFLKCLDVSLRHTKASRSKAAFMHRAAWSGFYAWNYRRLLQNSTTLPLLHSRVCI